MKITKNLLRTLIKECMQDMSYGNMTPQIVVEPFPKAKQYPIDPDGYEGRMAKANLNKIAEHASVLQSIIHDDENLEPWVQEKIAVAASMMDSVGQYLQYNNLRANKIAK